MWGLFSTMWGETDDMFPLWGVECEWEACGMMASLEKCRKGEYESMALCGVTDGDSKQQTEHYERGRHAASQFPVMTLGRQPCPAHPRSVTATKRNIEHLIWRGGLWTHHPACLSGIISGENPIKMGHKEHERYTWSQPCAVRCEWWNPEGENYIAVAASPFLCEIESIYYFILFSYDKDHMLMIYFFTLSKNIYF